MPEAQQVFASSLQNILENPKAFSSQTQFENASLDALNSFLIARSVEDSSQVSAQTFNQLSEELKITSNHPFVQAIAPVLQEFISFDSIGFTKACAAFSEASLHPNVNPLLRAYELQGLAICRWSQHQPEDAIEILQQAADVSQKNNSEHSLETALKILTGKILISNGQFASAQDAFQNALKQKPEPEQTTDQARTDLKTYANLGVVQSLWSQNKDEEALEFINQALLSNQVDEQIPKSKRTHASATLLENKGWTLIKLNQSQPAREAFESVLQLAENEIDNRTWRRHRIGAHRGLAHCLQSQKEFKKALTEVDTALQLTTDQFAEMIPALNQTKGWILMDLKQPASACQAFLLSKNALPKNADPSDKAGIGFALSRCHQEQKDFNQALSDVETALKYAPAKSSVALNLHTSRGWIESALNQPKQACDAFESAIALIPKNQIKELTDIQHGLGICKTNLQLISGGTLLSRGRPAESCEEFRKSADLAREFSLNEQLVLSHLGLTQCSWAQDKDNEALEFINQALLINVPEGKNHSPPPQS